MGEVQAIPLIDYNIISKQVQIKRTWRAIVGVRFFIASWLSLDTGVKYLSSAKGIADSEVNVGLNLMLPFKTHELVEIKKNTPTDGTISFEISIIDDSKGESNG